MKKAMNRTRHYHKLTLRRESIAVLTTPQLSHVMGGASDITTDYPNSMMDTCSTSSGILQ